jgi:hypothetical protein
MQKNFDDWIWGHFMPTTESMIPMGWYFFFSPDLLFTINTILDFPQPFSDIITTPQ